MSASETPRGPRCSSHSQTCARAEPGTDVPPQFGAVTNSTLIPIVRSSRLLAGVSSRSSGQVGCSPRLMWADGFPGACQSWIIYSDRKSVWLGLVWTVLYVMFLLNNI